MDNNKRKDDIRLEHLLDQHAAMSNRMIIRAQEQAAEIDNALNELFNNNDLTKYDDIDIIIDSKSYKLELRHAEVANIICCALMDIIKLNPND